MPRISAEEWQLTDVKPGDVVSFKVVDVKDGEVELSYDRPEVEEGAEMSEDEMRSMPLKEMERRLPKADREDY